MAKLESSDGSLSWDQWEDKLKQIGQSLADQRKSAEVEAIGSAVLMRDGMHGRTSLDLGVWMPNSKIDDLQAFRDAVESSGLALDSRGEFDESSAYVQLVKELDTMPDHQPEHSEKFGSLEVTYPSNEVIAASKLAAGRDKDIADLTYLASTGKLDEEKLDEMISKIPHELEREAAAENKIFVDPQIAGLQISQKEKVSQAEKFVRELDGLKKGQHGDISSDAVALNTKVNIALKNTVHTESKLSATQALAIKNGVF